MANVLQKYYNEQILQISYFVKTVLVKCLVETINFYKVYCQFFTWHENVYVGIVYMQSSDSL